VHKGDEKDIGTTDLVADTTALWVDTQTVFWDVDGSSVAKLSDGHAIFSQHRINKYAIHPLF